MTLSFCLGLNSRGRYAKLTIIIIISTLCFMGNLDRDLYYFALQQRALCSLLVSLPGCEIFNTWESKVQINCNKDVYESRHLSCFPHIVSFQYYAQFLYKGLLHSSHSILKNIARFYFGKLFIKGV